MRKSYIFLAFIMCIFNGFAENIYYVDKDGTVLNLGKSESPHVIKDRNMLENNGKFYIDGKENKAEGEKYRRDVMASTGYISVNKISDDVWTGYPEGSYIVRTYDNNRPIVVLKDLKIFGGLNENITPDVYSGYLVLKNGEMYHTDDAAFLSEDEKTDTDNIDLKSIEQIGNNYFKDKNGVYSYSYYGNPSYKPAFRKIKNADEKTFQVLGENYAKDGKKIYYKNKALGAKDTEGFQILKLWNAEPSVFIIGYSKDGIYYAGKKISNISLKGKAEVIGKTIFKDENQVYIFREYENSKAKIEKRDIPVNARYTKWIFDDEKYFYDPYLNVKTAKTEDFKWLNDGDIFQNNKKIYLISSMFGILEQEYDSSTFRLLYEGRFDKIAGDKDGYYLYSGESTEWKFRKIENEKIKLLDNTENIDGNLFYNSKNRKYYFLLDPYSGNVTELEGIKHVSEILLNSYIVGD